MTTSEPLTRTAALRLIDKIRADLPASARNALAPVVRDLHDGYPLADALAGIDYATNVAATVDYDTGQAVLAVIARTTEN